MTIITLCETKYLRVEFRKATIEIPKLTQNFTTAVADWVILFMVLTGTDKDGVLLIP